MERQMLHIAQADRTHCIDNTDPRALSEVRLRYVYEAYGDQDIEDLLDWFYGIKDGHLAEAADAHGSRTYKAVLT